MPASKKSEQQPEPIVLKRIEDEIVTVEVVGLTPVIPHRWSEKSLAQMRDKQQGLPRQKKPPKDAEEEARMSCYWLDEDESRPGLPATSFKGAMVNACRFFEKPSMVEAKTLFYVEGEGIDQLVEIHGEGTMREDTPRNASGVVDLRYRLAFLPWSVTLRIRYPKGYISRESVVALLDASGRVGVGDWRPGSPQSKTGTFGTYRVRG